VVQALSYGSILPFSKGKERYEKRFIKKFAPEDGPMMNWLLWRLDCPIKHY
jgi:hypothetical protein